MFLVGGERPVRQRANAPRRIHLAKKKGKKVNALPRQLIYFQNFAIICTSKTKAKGRY